MSVYKKLSDARVQLHSMNLKKSGVNAFSKYNYFELGDFLPQTLRIFNELGLLGYITFTTEYAQLNIIDIDGGIPISFSSPMSTANLKGAHEIQNLGAVQTYLRRYLWIAAMEIIENDIVDNIHDVKDEKKSNTTDIKELVPTMKTVWENAISAYKRDGNLDKVLERYSINDTNRELLIRQATA